LNLHYKSIQGLIINIKTIKLHIGLATVLLAISFPCLAEWEVIKHVDEMTDEVSVYIIVTNDTGHSLQIIRRENSIWANFRASESYALSKDNLIEMRIVT